MKKKRSKKKSRLSTRAFRLARTATVLRQRGNVARAMIHERKLDTLFDLADTKGGKTADAAQRAAEKGSRAGHKLYKKANSKKR
jgi:hypothetical protein